MKQYWILFLTAVCAIAGAIDTGKDMPELKVSEWYYHSNVDGGDIECVTLFDATARDAVATLRMLQSLQEEFSIPFCAIAVNGDRIAAPYIKAGGPFSITVGADDGTKTRITLADNESLFPYSVIAQKGKIIWTGHPAELESVIDRIRAGKFSLSDQRKIEALRKELQMAIQSGLPHVVQQTAEKILEISPSDQIAIQAKIMAMGTMGKRNEIPVFMRKVCAKNPHDIRLQFMYLSLLLQGGNRAEYIIAVNAFLKKFTKPDTRLINVLAFIIENTPYGLLMPDQRKQIADLALSSAKKIKDQKSVWYAVAYETKARTLAESGHFKDAVEFQQKSLAIRKGTRLENAARQRLNYYQALVVIQK